MKYHLVLIVFGCLAKKNPCATLLRGASTTTISQPKQSKQSNGHNANEKNDFDDNSLSATNTNTCPNTSKDAVDLILDNGDVIGNGWITHNHSHMRIGIDDNRLRQKEKTTCVHINVDEKKHAAKLSAVFIYYKCTPPVQNYPKNIHGNGREEPLLFNHYFDLRDDPMLTSPWCFDSLDCDDAAADNGNNRNGYIAFHAQFETILDRDGQKKKENNTWTTREEELDITSTKDLQQQRHAQEAISKLDEGPIKIDLTIEEEGSDIAILRETSSEPVDPVPIGPVPVTLAQYTTASTSPNEGNLNFDIQGPDATVFDTFPQESPDPGDITTVTGQEPQTLTVSQSDPAEAEASVSETGTPADGTLTTTDREIPEVLSTVDDEPTLDDPLGKVEGGAQQIDDPGTVLEPFDLYTDGNSKTVVDEEPKDITPVTSTNTGDLGISLPNPDPPLFDAYNPESNNPEDTTTIEVEQPQILVVGQNGSTTPLEFEAPIVGESPEEVTIVSAVDETGNLYEAGDGQVRIDPIPSDTVSTVIDSPPENDNLVQTVITVDAGGPEVPIEIQPIDPSIDPSFQVVDQDVLQITDNTPDDNVVVVIDPGTGQNDPPDEFTPRVDAEPEPEPDIGVTIPSEGETPETELVVEQDPSDPGDIDIGVREPTNGNDNDECFPASSVAVAQAIGQLSDETILNVQYRVVGSARRDSLVTINGLFDRFNYRAWCLDSDHPMCVNCLYPFDVSSSYRDDYSDITLPGGINNAAGLPAANWLINKYPVDTQLSGDDNLCAINISGAPTVTWNMFQTAIWKLIDLGYHRIARCEGGVCEEAADALVACALDQGSDYEPVCCDETLGVLLVWDNDVTGALSKQELVVEVPLGDIPGACPEEFSSGRLLEEDAPFYSGDFGTSITASAYFQESASSDGLTYYCQNNT